MTTLYGMTGGFVGGKEDDKDSGVIEDEEGEKSFYFLPPRRATSSEFHSMRLPCSVLWVFCGIYVRKPRSKFQEVLFFDNSADNPLQYPYMVLERLRGDNLEATWKDLTQDQKIIVAKEVGELYLQLRSATSAFTGEIKILLDKVEECIENPESMAIVEPFGMVEHQAMT
ncbi:hypothetical protein SUNI508_02790 [Seiridium unicorne]|uniref:Uncharacterized protein n=1 Tax=Seiridium unicorne TaxID=138068 RepID=A0ABR2VHF7_9PEZI